MIKFNNQKIKIKYYLIYNNKLHHFNKDQIEILNQKIEIKIQLNFYKKKNKIVNKKNKN